MSMPMPFGNPSTYDGHSGVDFGQPAGATIRASAPGTITQRGWLNDRAGYSATVDYDGGPPVLYCHQPSLARIPAFGSRVGEGSEIGVVGTTGRSDGPHLHMEIMSGAGAHTFAGIWNYFDRGRVVGQGSTSSTGSTPFHLKEKTMIFIRRERTNAAYVIAPAEYIKHVPNTRAEELLDYAVPGGAQFKGLNDGDLSSLLWDLGFPELEGNPDRLPTVAPGRDGFHWVPGR